MTAGPILVTGATGNIGAALTRLLRAAGHPVRAALRDPARAALLPAGVEPARFDFRDRGTYADALRGASKLFLLRPPDIANVGRDMIPLLEAAEALGVRQAVFASVLGAAKNPLAPHRAVERALRASGLEWTILRPGFFMQNLISPHGADIRDQSRIYLPAGAGETSFIDARDVAAAAARALTESGHAGRAYDLTGAEALGYEAAARLFSAELGRPIRYEPAGALGFLRHLRRQGHPWAYALVVLAIYLPTRVGLAAALTGETARLLGRPPTSLRQFIADHRAAWMPGATATADPAPRR